MPSGHAYAKALRTVKTCVGSEWCRFGTQDSTQMGKELERALWRMYAPHKVKLAVSRLPAQLRRVGHQGRRRDRRRFRLGDLRRRQRRHQDRGRAVPRQGEDRTTRCSSTPARSCSSIARKAGTSSAPCTTSAASGSTTSRSACSRTPRDRKALWERLQFALDGEPDPWHEPAAAQRRPAPVRAGRRLALTH